MRTLEAGHQYPSVLNLMIEEVFQVRWRGVVIGVEVENLVAKRTNYRRLLSRNG